MSKTIVALDCMGGDNAPFEIVKGAVEATNENKDILVKLVGVEEQIKEELSKYKYNSDQLEIVNATEIIETGEPPVAAIREKTDSSLVKCLYMVKKGEADGMVSAGSTGANLVGGHVIIGRLKGVERPPLAPLIPTKKGVSLLIDCGANVDARPSHLVQFAKMGSVYMENIVGIKNPKVAIVNIGAEEEKGNALVKETYPLLKEIKDINFVGNIEARDIPEGKAYRAHHCGHHSRGDRRGRFLVFCGRRRQGLQSSAGESAHVRRGAFLQRLCRVRALHFPPLFLPEHFRHSGHRREPGLFPCASFRPHA